MNVLKRNNVTISGAGEQAMVFVHGFGCDQRMWRLVAPAFREHYQVVLLDLVGSGQSDLASYDPVRYSSLEAHADDVLEVLHTLNQHQVVLVGHSVSAIIGLLASIREPSRFAQLVLVAPSPCYINNGNYIGGFEKADIEELLEAMDENYLGWSSTIAPVIMGHLERPELAAELNNSFCRTDPAIARHFARVTFLSDNRNDLPKVSTPSLILQSAHDLIAPIVVGTYLHRQLANSQLFVVETSGHCPHLSVPQVTIEAINRFLSAGVCRQYE
ncbi:alpha/beta hydrolase [Hymenobacter sp. GOD-10R]|uniref:alpha/beta fold hydrolase n=1 Tax=Hymenobacter sp. GOD-10R TaxID=3093922 RepID=UPI002D776428|nr:alpha/beta hydrolase [Hymenobacter sp. GOD-10R]WRQ30387.1 alpha/beta hydrolase [Hymenobacter sp. GOD-10R]